MYAKLKKLFNYGSVARKLLFVWLTGLAGTQGLPKPAGDPVKV